MQMTHIAVIYAQPYSDAQHDALETVRDTLKKFDIKAKYFERTRAQKKHVLGKDLVLAVGGDGTFLRAALLIDDATPIFGINSDPKTKEGFYMKSLPEKFDVHLHKIMKDDFKVAKLTRLRASINGKEISCEALNEFFVGAEKGFMTSRYKLNVRNHTESQRSSGIIVATPTGSHAWFKATGGAPLDFEHTGFVYRVREPYEHDVYSNYKNKEGVLEAGEHISIASEMERAVLVADSIGKEHHLKYNDEVVIAQSEQVVHSIRVD